MTYICPTVTAYDIKSFQEQFVLVSQFADRIHIDIMDGEFTPTSSPRLPELTLKTDKIMDVHVMYRRPNDIISELIALRPHLVIVHAESDVDMPLFATKMRQHGIKTGLALLPETSVASVALLLPHVQHVLIFGGHLGYHGSEADITQLLKVEQVKRYSKYVDFGWDGGANLVNVQQLSDAGIDVINVGGAIHTAPDPAAMYLQLVEAVS